MKKYLIGLFFLFLTLFGNSQSSCDMPFARDTMSLPATGKSVEGEYLETTLKNLSVVRIFRAEDGKYFLRIVISKNFYFDRVGTLEIKSGKKIYYEKDCQQYKLSKTSGMYMLEIYKNYLYTLKDEGITSLVFNRAETNFTKQDAAQIKKIAKCFYDTYFESKK